MKNKRSILIQQKHFELIEFADTIDFLLPKFLKINSDLDQARDVYVLFLFFLLIFINLFYLLFLISIYFLL